MSAGRVHVAVDGDVANVTLAHPGKRNAISEAMWHALGQAFRDFAQAPLRAVVVRGADGHFAAGADIAEFDRIRMTRDDAVRYHADTLGAALVAIEECPHATIAAITGNCVGGGLEIALACDLRLASPDAVFGAPVTKLGFALALAEMRLLLDTVGRTTACELLVEGRLLTAHEAQARGLVTRVSDGLQEEVAATIARIRAGSPEALRETKEFMRRLAADRTAAGTALGDNEIRASMAFAERDDYRARVAAFLERNGSG